MICQCPAATAIPTIPNSVCPENFGQIQKVAFQRLRQADGTKNSFAAASGTPTTPTITLLASWTAKMAATNGTKIAISPYVNAPADSGGDARMSSGGNDDLGGIATVLGGNPVQFAGQFRAIDQSVIEKIKELQCEAAAGNLGVYLFDEHGRIEAIQDKTEPNTYYPIPIRSLFVGDKIHGNYDGKDYNPVQWSYPENYSDGLKIVTPSDFNPLTDLIPA